MENNTYLELNQKKLYTNVHSSIIHSSQIMKQCKYPLSDKWISQRWYIHEIEYYMEVKISEVLINATMGMYLENMLSERSQSQKTTSHMTAFFFLRGHLLYLLIKWLLTTIKFSIGGSMLNVQSLIHLKPNSCQSPIFWSITNKFLHGEWILT